MPPCRVPIGLWWRSSTSISKTARPGSIAFSTNPSSRPIGGGGASPRCNLRARSRIVAMYISSKQVLFVAEPTFFWMRHCSVYPGGLALDLLAVERSAPDHAVGPVLEAEEVQRRFRVVAPG